VKSFYISQRRTEAHRVFFSSSLCASVRLCVYYSLLLFQMTLVAVIALLSVQLSALADQLEMCMYTDSRGVIQQVQSKNSVPLDFQQSARCFPVQKGRYLAPPDQVEISGSERRVEMSSSVGRITLRWPRTSERLFGRTPERAMADAARAVSRALRSSGFPAKVQNLDLQWNVVFMDAELPGTQVPSYLVNNCHPAWMTPPANIYVVSQRVAAGCGGAPPPRPSEVDAQLAEVLIHEMGHAVEAQIMGARFARDRDRMRSEGFATWFEAYASDFSSVIRRGSVRDKHFQAARHSINASPEQFFFRGSGGDYARASMYFHAIVDRTSIRRLMSVYDRMERDNLNFLDAVERELRWSPRMIREQIDRILR